MANAEATAQERYFDGLMERVREDRYPSTELLDRIEASFWTTEQVVDYVDMLLEKLGLRNRVDLTRYAIRRGLVEP